MGRGGRGTLQRERHSSFSPSAPSPFSPIPLTSCCRILVVCVSSRHSPPRFVFISLSRALSLSLSHPTSPLSLSPTPPFPPPPSPPVSSRRSCSPAQGAVAGPAHDRSPPSPFGGEGDGTGHPGACEQEGDIGHRCASFECVCVLAERDGPFFFERPSFKTKNPARPGPRFIEKLGTGTTEEAGTAGAEEVGGRKGRRERS